MARSVGRVEVTVDADTSQLKAKIVKDARTAGKAAATIIDEELDDLEAKITDVDATGAKRQMDVLKKQFEAQLKGIDVGLDLTQARNDLRLAKEQIEAEELALNVTISNRDIAEIQARLEAMEDEKIELQAEADMQAALEEVEFQVKKFNSEQHELELQAEADMAATFARVEFQIKKFNSEQHQIEVDVEANVAAASAAIDAWVARQNLERHSIKVQADIDEDQLNNTTRRKLIAWASDAGGEAGSAAGDSFGNNFLSGDDTKLLIAAIAAVGDAAGAALSGVAADAVAILGSAFVSLASAAGAVIPIISGLGLVLGGTIVGMQGFGTAIGAVNDEFAKSVAQGRAFSLSTQEIQEAMRGLAPEARAAVVAFADMRAEFDNMRLETQNALFKDMDAVLLDMGKSTIPDLTGALVGAATSVNEFAKELAVVASNTNFTRMWLSVKDAVDEVFDAVIDVVRIWEPFVIAAGPAAEDLAHWLHQGAEELRRWVENNPEAIATFLEEGVDSLREWGRLLQRTGDLLGTVFAAGEEAGTGFVRSLGTIIERWDAWLESTEGQTALAEWFADGQAVMEALKPVLDGLVEAFQRLTTESSFENFGELAEAVGSALPALAELLSLLGEAGLLTALLSLAPAIQAISSLLNALPDGVLETVGMMIALSLAFGKVTAAIKTMTLVLSTANPILLALTAAVAVAVVAYQHLSGGTDQVAQRSGELTNTLDGVVDALIREKGAAEETDLALRALSEALIETGDDGKKLQTALGAVGKDASQATEVLLDLGRDPLKAMSELAQGMGLTAEQAEELAGIVNNTDDSFDAVQQTLGALGGETSLTTEELANLAAQMEELQDQEEKTDFKKIINEQFEMARGSDELSDAVKNLIPTLGDLANMTEDEMVAAYDAFIQAQAEEVAATEEGIEAAKKYTSSQQIVASEIRRVTEARALAVETLKTQGLEAFNTAEAEEELDKATRSALTSMLEGEGVSREFSSGMMKIGDAARDASEQADALTNSFDILFGRAMTSQEAFDSFYTGINEVTAAFAAGELQQVNYLQALFATDEAAIAFRETLREGATGLMDNAAALIANQAPLDTILSQTEAMRQSLEDQAVAFGLSEEEATEYVNTLIGTPEELTTLISTPGLIDALLNAEDLTLLYDEAGEPVKTQFEALGLDAAIGDSEVFQGLVEDIGKMSADVPINATTAVPTKAEVDAVKTSTEELADASADPEIEASGAKPTQKEVEATTKAVEKLDEASADPDIQLTDYTLVKTRLDTLNELIGDLPERVSVTILLPGISARTEEVRELRRQIDLLRDRTINITTNNRTIGGDMAGRIIHGEQITRVGERGLAEAIVPLQLPLSRVDPSVRDMAALLRGEGLPEATATTGTTHNHQWNINEVGDGRATAHRVINRMLAVI